MPLYLIFVILIPVVTYFGLPKLMGHYLHRRPTGPMLLLAIAGMVFAVSWFIPSILIDGYDTSSSKHFVGGGLFSGFVWAYVLACFDKKLPLSLELLSLFALVSILTVISELSELWLHEIVGIRINSFDVWWDILANVLGAATFYVGWKSIKMLLIRIRS